MSSCSLQIWFQERVPLKTETRDSMVEHYFWIDAKDDVAAGDCPTNCRPGYILTVRLIGHENCGCFRSRNLYIFRSHPLPAGIWPMHYLALEHLVNTELSQFTLISHSYGYVKAGRTLAPFSMDAV